MKATVIWYDRENDTGKWSRSIDIPVVPSAGDMCDFMWKKGDTHASVHGEVRKVHHAFLPGEYGVTITIDCTLIVGDPRPKRGEGDDE